jgi:hypothetical protein
MTDRICRAIATKDGQVTYSSAVAQGSTLEQIIEDDKKYGKMAPYNGKYFTYKAMDWEGKWISKKEIINGITLVWNMAEKFLDIKAYEAKDGEYVDFKIYFRNTSDDPQLTDDTLQYHFYPINDFNNPNRGVCVVNIDHPYTSHGDGIPMHEYDPTHYPNPTTAKKFDYDFDAIYFHEAVGHGLGLPHSPNKNTKMWGNYLGMIESVFDEEPWETIPRLQAKYPKRNMIIRILQRWINYFKARQDRF